MSRKQIIYLAQRNLFESFRCGRHYRNNFSTCKQCMQTLHDLAQCRHLHCWISIATPICEMVVLPMGVACALASPLTTEHGIAFARRCVVGLVRLRTGSARRPTTKAPLTRALGPPLFPAVSTPPNKRRKGVENKSPCSSHGHSALDAHTAASTTLSRGHARGFWLASFDVRLLIACNWAELCEGGSGFGNGSGRAA